MSIESLRAEHCQPRKGKEAGLAAGAIASYLKDLPGWTKAADGGSKFASLRSQMNPAA